MPLMYSTANDIINNMLTGRSNSTISKGSIYLALSTTTPSRDGTGITEPTLALYNGYARKLIGQYNQSYTQLIEAPVDGVATNSTQYIMFPVAEIGSSGCTVTHIVFYPSATGGSPIAYAQLTNSVTIPQITSIKVVPVFDPSALTITVT